VEGSPFRIKGERISMNDERSSLTGQSEDDSLFGISATGGNIGLGLAVSLITLLVFTLAEFVLFIQLLEDSDVFTEL